MPELYHFHTSVESVFKDTRIYPASMIELDLRDLCGQISLAQTELRHVNGDAGEGCASGDMFYTNVTGFCLQAAGDMEAVELLFGTMQQQMLATTVFFGEPNWSTDQLFEQVQEFAHDYRAAQLEHHVLIKT